MQEVFTVKSPWLSTFKTFIGKAERELFLVAPYVAKYPLQLVASILNTKPQMRVHLVTDFALSSLQSGSLDVNAITEFVRAVPNVTVVHLSHLHAKIYLSEREAIITSANLTNNGLQHNYEYGTLLANAETIANIRDDLTDYLKTGSTLDEAVLTQVAASVERVQKTAADYESTRRGRSALKAALAQNQEELVVQLLSARTATESIDSIFQRTILYLMTRYSPLTTPELHALVQLHQPDLCDDTTDRTINGVSFGKKWKHQVRTAQQGLKRRGLLELRDDKWHLLS